MERNLGGIFIYKTHEPMGYVFIDCRTTPFERVLDMPRSFNIWQNTGQLKIWLIAQGIRPWPLPLSN